VRTLRQKDQIKLNLGTDAKGEARSAATQESEACTAEACLERPAVASPRCDFARGNKWAAQVSLNGIG
jgi:RNA-directed DNA polymerase